MWKRSCRNAIDQKSYRLKSYGLKSPKNIEFNRAELGVLKLSNSKEAVSKLHHRVVLLREVVLIEKRTLRVANYSPQVSRIL